MVVHVCNPSTWNAEAMDLWVPELDTRLQILVITENRYNIEPSKQSSKKKKYVRSKNSQERNGQRSKWKPRVKIGWQSIKKLFYEIIRPPQLLTGPVRRGLKPTVALSSAFTFKAFALFSYITMQTNV